jgi:hypothetical protein
LVVGCFTHDTLSLTLRNPDAPPHRKIFKPIAARTQGFIRTDVLALTLRYTSPIDHPLKSVSIDQPRHNPHFPFKPQENGKTFHDLSANYSFGSKKQQQFSNTALSNHPMLIVVLLGDCFVCLNAHTKNIKTPNNNNNNNNKRLLVAFTSSHNNALRKRERERQSKLFRALCRTAKRSTKRAKESSSARLILGWL